MLVAHLAWRGVTELMPVRGSGEPGALVGALGVEILVAVEAPEVRVAEVRGGRLWGLDVDRGGRLLGDIFKGRVSNVVPGMDAAFVDIGLEHNALLYEGDVVRDSVRPGSGGGRAWGGLRSGDEVLVQVARPPVGSKGARVTMRLSLPGRYVVLSEQSDTVGVSRRLGNEGRENPIEAPGREAEAAGSWALWCALRPRAPQRRSWPRT